jgi:hypothetical protein
MPASPGFFNGPAFPGPGAEPVVSGGPSTAVSVGATGSTAVVGTTEMQTSSPGEPGYHVDTVIEVSPTPPAVFAIPGGLPADALSVVLIAVAAVLLVWAYVIALAQSRLYRPRAP